MSERKPTNILISSALASTISNALTNPLDVVKVRIQNDAKKCCCTHPSVCSFRSSPIVKAESIGHASVYSLMKSRSIQSDFRVPCDCVPFRTNVKALVYLARKEGPLTLANGLTQTALASSVSAVLFFSLYEAARKRVTTFTSNTVMIPLLSALFARTITTTITSPFEYLKTVQQSSVGKNKKSALKLGKSFNAGFRSHLIRDVIFACVCWVFAENIRTEIKGLLQKKDDKGYQDKETLFISNLVAGGISGAVGSFVSIPFDVVKTRKQLYPKEYRKKTITRILRDVYAAEGLKGLFLGSRQRIWKVTLSNAGILTLYEFFMDMMNGKRLEPK